MIFTFRSWFWCLSLKIHSFHFLDTLMPFPPAVITLCVSGHIELISPFTLDKKKETKKEKKNQTSGLRRVRMRSTFTDSAAVTCINRLTLQLATWHSGKLSYLFQHSAWTHNKFSTHPHSSSAQTWSLSLKGRLKWNTYKVKAGSHVCTWSALAHVQLWTEMKIKQDCCLVSPSSAEKLCVYFRMLIKYFAPVFK